MATWYSREGHTVRATLYATNGNIEFHMTDTPSWNGTPNSNLVHT